MLKLQLLILKDNNDVKKNLKKIINTEGPILVDVMIDPRARVKPKIEYGKPLHNMSPLLPVNEINEILKN